MIRLKVFVVLFLIYFGFQIAGVASQFRPRIHPDTKDTQVIPPRELSLGCEGVGINENVTWSVPDNSEFWTLSNFDRRMLNAKGEEEALPKYFSRTKDQIQITYSNISDEVVVGQINSAALLMMQNITYSDIGYYTCHIMGVNIDYDDAWSKIFVFVKNKERLAFLPTDKTYVINARKNKDNVTFPCIPSNTNTTVVLKASSSARNSESYTEISPEISGFSPHVGYQLKVSETDFDMFTCEFRNYGRLEKIYFKVRYTNFSDYSVVPYINETLDFIDKKSGEDLILTCTIAVDSDNTSSLIWVTPKNSSTNVEIKNSTFRLYDGHLRVVSLHVKNLTADDAGEYACKSNDTTITGYVAKKFISIDVDPELPKPKINSTSRYTIKAGQDLILTCEGKRNLTWSIPTYPDKKTEVTITDLEDSSSKSDIHVKYLKITKASYYNTGHYYCHDNKSQKNDPNLSSEVFVYVEDKFNFNSNPKKKFVTKTPEYSNVIIPCIPTSQDINVTLFDTRTSQERPEQYIPLKGFSVYVPEDDILTNLECRFKKGDKTKRQSNVIDVQRTFKYENIPLLSTADNVYTFTGGALILFCSVIVKQDFYPNISWATPGQPEFLTNQTQNISESNYMIANGRVFISTLTINNIGLGDSREYECSFQDEKNKTRFDRKVLSLNIEFNIKPYIEARRELAVGETLVANCTVRADHNIRFTMDWITPVTDDRRTITTPNIILDVYGYKGDNKLILKNVTYDDTGNYTCKIKDHKNNTNEETVFISIIAPMPANIEEHHNMINGTKTIVLGDNFEMKCKINLNDIPTPSISWYKDNRLITSNGTQEISIDFAVVEDSGVYSCNVTNSIGHASRWVRLEVQGGDLQPATKLFIGIISGLILIFGSLAAVFARRILRDRRLQRRLKEVGLINFEKGQEENLNPNISISDQAELLPYNKKWEIPKDRIKLGKQLGSGQFGVVVKGEVFGVFVGETIKTVAIKTSHKNPDYQSVKALVNELKIMTYMGKHLNVVNLLGACTSNIKKREIFLLTEYCLFGNIRNHLLARREFFINQIDPETGLIDIDNIDPSLYQKVIPSEEELSRLLNPYMNVEKPAKRRKFSIADYISSNKTTSTEKNDYMNMPKPEKPKERPKFVSTHDLLCWSFQVARGMDYLSSRKILHGDLAARNVLLTDNNVVKICDFGLSKNMYKYKNYKKKTKTPLPIKWMALESIRDRMFSVQSDIWSFGVVLWELFTLARMPYPEMEPDAKFVKELENGLRMEQPEFATSDIYQIMMECWNEIPGKRPTFPELVELLGSMIHENVKKHYIELNRPYENLNIAEKSPNYIEMLTKKKKRSPVIANEAVKSENGENFERVEPDIEAISDENSESREPQIGDEKSDEGFVEDKESDTDDAKSSENDNNCKEKGIDPTSSDSQVRKRFKSVVEAEVHASPE